MKHVVKLLFVFFVSVYSQSSIATVTVVPAAPDINAKSYILFDYASNKLLAEKNKDERLAPASLTKIMTVYVVAKELEQGSIKLTDQVLVSEKAWKMLGSRMFIEVNKQVAVEDLLKGVVVQSGNDASVALAEYISGTEEVFAQLMNKYAEILGMKNTHFMNSTGLPHEDHYSTAYDLAILSKALIDEYPKIYEMHSIKEYTYNDITQSNRNQLLWRDPSVDGLKTGHTEAAGYCLVASALREDMRLITVVMGTNSSEARTKATQALLNYGFRFYETKEIYNKEQTVEKVKVWKGKAKELDLGVKEPLVVTFPRGQLDKLKATVVTNEKLVAPIAVGQDIGTLTIELNGEKQVSVPLVALQNVELAGLINRIKDSIYLMME